MLIQLLNDDNLYYKKKKKWEYFDFIPSFFLSRFISRTIITVFLINDDIHIPIRTNKT